MGRGTGDRPEILCAVRLGKIAIKRKQARIIIQKIILGYGMDIQLKRWGNSLGLRIPHRLAESFGWDETSTVEMQEVDGALVIRKKSVPVTLEELLASIPADFHYPDDVQDFINGGVVGQEFL